MREHRLFGAIVAASFAVVVLCIATCARGQGIGAVTMQPAKPIQCPPDRPHRRVVQQPVSMCTLAMCVKMVCGKDTDRCEMVPTQECNTCTRAPDIEICLTQQELDAAK